MCEYDLFSNNKRPIVHVKIEEVNKKLKVGDFSKEITR